LFAECNHCLKYDSLFPTSLFRIAFIRDVHHEIVKRSFASFNFPPLLTFRRLTLPLPSSPPTVGDRSKRASFHGERLVARASVAPPQWNFGRSRVCFGGTRHRPRRLGCAIRCEIGVRRSIPAGRSCVRARARVPARCVFMCPCASVRPFVAAVCMRAYTYAW